MFKFITGDILESDAECLVNTVNCEGYMGKGIAYQFKLRYPENNKDYVKACKSGTLRIGAIHSFNEQGKFIINFPTKNKWRENSKLEYIHAGLEELVKLLQYSDVRTIAIPPLGCGNGGLQWPEVKQIILKHLSPLSYSMEIILFEPSKYYKSKAVEPKKLTSAHLTLMSFKSKLAYFSKLRLQKAAYFLNIFLGENYFKFEKHKFGPYAHSIDVLIKDIKEFQDHYNIDTNGAFNLIRNRLISESVEKKLEAFSPFIDQAATFVNSIPSDKELELLSTICLIVQQNPEASNEEIIAEVKDWSEDKAKRFSEDDILTGIRHLLNKNILHPNLMGYSVNRPLQIN